MNQPHHIAIANSTTPEKYYIKFPVAMEIGEYIYVLKLPIGLFRAFLALAAGAVTTKTGFVSHDTLYTGGRKIPSGVSNVRTTLRRLEAELVRQTFNKWTAPIERNRYCKQARLNIANKCEFEFSLFSIMEFSGDKHVRATARKIAATWDKTPNPSFKEKESRRSSEVEVQERGYFLVRRES